MGKTKSTLNDETIQINCMGCTLMKWATILNIGKGNIILDAAMAMITVVVMF